MALCTSLTQILKSCDNNMGGIQGLWLWDMEDVVGASASFNTTTYTWDSYNVTGGATATPTGYTFIRNSSNYTEETNIDLGNGSTYVTATLNLIFTRREALKSKSIKILGEGQRYLGALVLDSNGLYWLFEDLQLSATGEGSGTAKADGSKYSVTLVAENLDLAGEVSAADAALLIANGFFV
jgi:hypothetical protein